MKKVVWARHDEGVLTLFRREVVETARGEALADVPVLVLEDSAGKVGQVPEAVELEVDVTTEADGTVSIHAKASMTNERPKDPKPTMRKFDDPESDRRKVARGMSRFLGKEDQSKPVSRSATPPVPREQKVGGRGTARGTSKATGPKRVVRRRGASRRGAARPQKKPQNPPETT